MICLFDSVLESHIAREIADNNNKTLPQYEPQTEEEAAKEWFREVIPEGGYNIGDMPKYHRFVDDLENGWELYYDFGADYYFAVNPNLKEDNENE